MLSQWPFQTFKAIRYEATLQASLHEHKNPDALALTYFLIHPAHFLPRIPQHLSLPHTPLVPDGRLETPEKEVVPMLLKSHVLTNCDYMMLLFAQALICALCNGILPSIQSYASLPYGTYSSPFGQPL